MNRRTLYWIGTLFFPLLGAGLWALAFPWFSPFAGTALFLLSPLCFWNGLALVLGFAGLRHSRAYRLTYALLAWGFCAVSVVGLFSPAALSCFLVFALVCLAGITLFFEEESS